MKKVTWFEVQCIQCNFPFLVYGKGSCGYILIGFTIVQEHWNTPQGAKLWSYLMLNLSKVYGTNQAITAAIKVIVYTH